MSTETQRRIDAANRLAQETADLAALHRRQADTWGDAMSKLRVLEKELAAGNASCLQEFGGVLAVTNSAAYCETYSKLLRARKDWLEAVEAARDALAEERGLKPFKEVVNT